MLSGSYQFSLHLSVLETVHRKVSVVVESCNDLAGVLTKGLSGVTIGLHSCRRTISYFYII